MRVKSQLLLVAVLLTFDGGQAQKEGVSTIFGRRPAASQGRINQSPLRSGKSLLSTFPFSARDQHDHHHHHEHHEHQDSRISRQGNLPESNVALDIGTIAAAGERCVDKVVMVQETEYDDEILCKHSYSERCHITYKTDYEPQQEEQCDENYRKKCYIEFKNVASQEKVQFCFTPLVKNCNTPGPTECTTEYRSECTTRYHEHEVEEDTPICREEQEQKCQQVTQGYSTKEECTKWPITRCTLEKKVVKKYSPETDCKKVPFQLCGPSGCPVEPGKEQCFDKSETVVQEVPEEQCTLEPQRECKQVTKLVPLLKPVEECVDIPKEVCVRQRKNPRRIQKPIVKKWCYTPTKESGLLPPPAPRPPPTTRPPRPVSDEPIPDQEQGSRPDYQTEPPPKGCNPQYDVSYCPQKAGDGRCDPECNTGPCNFDGGDCAPKPTTPPPSCSPGYPATHCPQMAGNGRCNPECNTQACGFDGGECEILPPTNGYLPPPSTYKGK